MLRAPTLPMQVVMAPTRFWLPSSTSAGPNRICVRSGHAPMIAAARRFVRFGECAAHHDGVCATSQRFANVATSTHPSIGDDRHVTQCFFEVSVTRRRAIDRRGNLRNTKSKHAARSASRPGSDADQNRGWPTLHDLEGHVVANSISDDYRDTHFTAKLFQVERPILRRNMPDCRNCALHHENISASILRDPAKFSGT